MTEVNGDVHVEIPGQRTTIKAAKRVAAHDKG
jgi:hypothetical protein